MGKCQETRTPTTDDDDDDDNCEDCLSMTSRRREKKEKKKKERKKERKKGESNVIHQNATSWNEELSLQRTEIDLVRKLNSMLIVVRRRNMRSTI